MIHMKEKIERSTLACRVTPDELLRIDRLIEETGQSRAEWLYQLAMQALGETDVSTVRGMSDRLTALEKKLAKLSQLIVA